MAKTAARRLDQPGGPAGGGERRRLEHRQAGLDTSDPALQRDDATRNFDDPREHPRRDPAAPRRGEVPDKRLTVDKLAGQRPHFGGASVEPRRLAPAIGFRALRIGIGAPLERMQRPAGHPAACGVLGDGVAIRFDGPVASDLEQAPREQWPAGKRIGAETQEGRARFTGPVEFQFGRVTNETREIGLVMLGHPRIQIGHSGKGGELRYRPADQVALDETAEIADRAPHALALTGIDGFGDAAGLDRQRVRPFADDRPHYRQQPRPRRQHRRRRAAGAGRET